MKKITTVLLLCFISSITFAQLGVGLGNGGLNIKSSHENKFGVIGRLGLGYGAGQLIASPSVSAIARVFTSENAKPYFGIGVGSWFAFSNNTFGYNTFIPIGVEVFPMGNKRMSITVESGVGMSSFNNSFIYSGFRGLLEFTFYFGSKK